MKFEHLIGVYSLLWLSLDYVTFVGLFGVFGVGLFVVY